MLVTVSRNGSLSTDAIVRLLGHSGDDALARLAATPSILTGGSSGWRLARPAEAITVGEVRERCGASSPRTGDEGLETLTLAALVKQSNSGEAVPVEPGADLSLG